jgi:hypothetical protein
MRNRLGLSKKRRNHDISLPGLIHCPPSGYNRGVMSPEPVQILSYATPERPRRFGHVRIIFPFCGGLLAGGAAAAVILALTPDFAMTRAYYCFSLLAVLAYLILAATCALIVLLVMAWISALPRVPRSARFAGTVAFVCPVVGTTFTLFFYVLAVLTSPPDWMVPYGVPVALLPASLMMFAAPFFLVERTRSRESPNAAPRRFPVNRTPSVVLVLAFLAMIETGRWMAWNEFDRQCRAIVASARPHCPTPGSYPNLTLSDRQLWLLDWGDNFDAFVLNDGRMLILLKRGNFWTGWTATVYFSGPIKPGEIGPGSNGKTQILIAGMPDHYVWRQLDSQNVIIRSDPD